MVPVLFTFAYIQTRGEEGVQSIKQAIDIGYRHIDTAYRYGNEREVGRAVNEKIREGFVAREDLFITTKVRSERKSGLFPISNKSENVFSYGIHFTPHSMWPKLSNVRWIT